MNKAESAVIRLKEINPSIEFKNINIKLTYDNAESILKKYNLIIDCTDNFEARFIINDVCVLNRIPFVSGAAVGLEGGCCYNNSSKCNNQ